MCTFLLLISLTLAIVVVQIEHVLANVNKVSQYSFSILRTLFYSKLQPIMPVIVVIS